MRQHYRASGKVSTNANSRMSCFFTIFFLLINYKT